MQIFAKIKYLYKRLRIVIRSNQDLWDTIAIMIILNTLYEDNNITTASLLEADDKMID